MSEATGRNRPADEVGADPGDGGRDPRARGAVVALAVSAVGVIGFVVGLRIALQRAPADRPTAAAGDSARNQAEFDSVTAARRRLAPRAPTDSGGREDLPRLR
jgi:hypothetical protein